jgi:hypothetical protein
MFASIAALWARIKALFKKEELTVMSALGMFQDALGQLKTVAEHHEQLAQQHFTDAGVSLGKAYDSVAESTAAKAIGSKIAGLLTPDEPAAQPEEAAQPTTATSCDDPACVVCAAADTSAPVQNQAAQPADGSASASA